MDINIKLENYLNEHLKPRKQRVSIFENVEEEAFAGAYAYKSSNVNEYIDKNKEEETFQTKLFKYIDRRNLKDSDVYNKVNIDRRLFSKIRSNKEYHPSKETIILFGIALELSEEEIEDLLRSASYSLPKNTIFDLIIRFCFKERIFNISQVNELLYNYNCKTLN